MDIIEEQVIVPLATFTKNSKMLLQKCTKPNNREFWKLGTSTMIGFAFLGFLGFFVKLVFIPINNVIMIS